MTLGSSFILNLDTAEWYILLKRKERGTRDGPVSKELYQKRLDQWGGHNRLRL